MKKPQRPPAVDDLMKRVFVEPQTITRMIQADHGPLVNDRYLHWDQLRRRSAPEGWTHEQWWLAIKLSRSAQAHALPLTDPKGRAFKFILPDLLSEQLHHVDLGAGGRIEMPQAITNPETRDQYYVASLMEEAITSSQLEGAATTREIAKEMIRTKRQPRDEGEQMILNNYRTMKSIEAFKNEPLSKNLILKIHRLVTDKTLDDPTASGRFRRENEYKIVGDDYGEVFHEPPSADLLEDRIESLCRFANADKPFVHPVIRAIIIHFMIAYEHPFVDGNGRTARALFYWSMLRQGYWLFEFISISQAIRQAPVKYGKAFLHTETDDNDLTYFIAYHLEMVQQAIEKLHAYIGRKTEQVQAAERELQGMAELNHRQKTLVSHALRHPHQVYTIRSHQESHGVVYQTARNDLQDLERRQLLKSRKVGKVWHFRRAADLEKRLKEVLP